MGQRGMRILRTLALASVGAMWPGTAAAQLTRVFTAGGGASFPAGGTGQGMNTGWLAEVMGGVTLPGNTVTLRLGGSYGRYRIDPVVGGGMMGGGTGAGGVDRTLGVMAAVMVMPDIDRDLIPYALLGAGAMNSSFRGSTKFAWTSGLGATVQTAIAAFYVEGRFVRARNSGRSSDMISLTAGIRIGD